MNPCEKYRARKHIPWKLGVQVLKIIMVTTQVRPPGHRRSSSKAQIFVLSAGEAPLTFISSAENMSKPHPSEWCRLILLLSYGGGGGSFSFSTFFCCLKQYQ